MTFAEHVNSFNKSLALTTKLPDGIVVMNPFEEMETYRLSSVFYNKYYNDSHKRKLILGINPGRFGAGLTGIPFTDPVKLENNCGIANNLNKATEPSAGFMYDMIDAFGGPEKFYHEYFINSISPLGFMKNGINYNYYDSKELELIVTPFIISSIQKIIKFGISTEVCFCLGIGKNFNYLKNLNKQYSFFDKVVPLPHPRWVVQYRRKKYDHFISEYLTALG
jgi:hypothetical protein